MTIDLVSLLKEQASGPLLEKTAALLGENVDVVEKGILASAGELLGCIQEKFSSGQGEDIFKSFGDGSKLDKLPQHLAGGNQTVNYLSQGLDKSRELFGSNADSIMQNIAGVSGLKHFSVGSLLGVVSPMLLGLLGKQKANGLDIAGFTSLLESQASSIADLAKPSVEFVIAEENPDKALSPIDTTAELKVAKDITKTGNFGFLKVLIPLFLLAAAGFFFAVVVAPNNVLLVSSQLELLEGARRDLRGPRLGGGRAGPRNNPPVARYRPLRCRDGCAGAGSLH